MVYPQKPLVKIVIGYYLTGAVMNRQDEEGAKKTSGSGETDTERIPDAETKSR